MKNKLLIATGLIVALNGCGKQDNLEAIAKNQQPIKQQANSDLEKYILLTDLPKGLSLWGGYKPGINPHKVEDDDFEGELKLEEGNKAFYFNGSNRSLFVVDIKLIPGQKSPDKIERLTEQTIKNKALAIYKAGNNRYILVGHDLPYAAFENNEEAEEVKEILKKFSKQHNLEQLWRNQVLDFNVGR